MSDNAHTAQAAADSLGCDVAQIAKSIVFRLKESDSPLLVIASGINLVNEKKICHSRDNESFSGCMTGCSMLYNRVRVVCC
ncbi:MULTISPECIES: YbaK/EbsC family protein [Paenibacillus]|uniref:YbaK/EbsC family protein n=1 Tax=Paenibacillus TaxID=44249 RepID=UPI0011A68BD3|nr:YbaK/EbsC family protein [Paenibacillus sp. IHBB 10380]